jgi:hypothetical protein
LSRLRDDDVDVDSGSELVEPVDEPELNGDDEVPANKLLKSSRADEPPLLLAASMSSQFSSSSVSACAAKFGAAAGAATSFLSVTFLVDFDEGAAVFFRTEHQRVKKLYTCVSVSGRVQEKAHQHTGSKNARPHLYAISLTLFEFFVVLNNIFSDRLKRL